MQPSVFKWMPFENGHFPNADMIILLWYNNRYCEACVLHVATSLTLIWLASNRIIRNSFINRTIRTSHIRLIFYSQNPTLHTIEYRLMTFVRYFKAFQFAKDSNIKQSFHWRYPTYGRMNFAFESHTVGKWRNYYFVTCLWFNEEFNFLL